MRFQARMLAPLFIAAISASTMGQLSLTTTLAAGNSQSGNMFDIEATGGQPLLIQSFDVHPVGTSTVTVEVYTVTAGTSYVGNEANSGAWTLLATVPNVTGLGTGIAVPLNLTLNEQLPVGVRKGFYVTAVTGGSLNYTNGTAAGNVFASNSTLTFYEGIGISYAFGTIFTPRIFNGVIHYGPASGLIANFSASPTSGSAPLTVNFTDASFSSDPGGVTSWAWDVNNDGIDDYFVQNPTHTYSCPGPYSVRLTVTDAMHPPSTVTQTNMITVGNPAFAMTTTGGGVGDLTVTPVGTSCFPAATEGFTLISFAGTMAPVGSGPFLGIAPDALTLVIITTPAAPGNIFHFVPSGALYPNGGPLNFPPGFFSALTGFSMDATEVLLNASRQIVLATNVARVTF